MTYTMILAAGKQTRFESDIPKCLYPYKGDPRYTILEKNIETAHAYGTQVMVVVNIENDNSKIYDIVNRINKKNTYMLGVGLYVIEIKSGKGTGHAIYETLKNLIINNNDKCFLMWGDSIQDKLDLYVECYQGYNGIMTVPLRKEEKCYMKFDVDEDTYLITGAHKPIEPILGYHDYSFFLFNMSHMFNMLSVYVSMSTSTIYNNIQLQPEIDFIQLFNFCPNVFNVILPEFSSINAFNTIEEYEKL